MYSYRGILSVIVIGITMSLNGCYTQLLVKDDCYEESTTIVIYYPPPIPPPPPQVPDPISPTIFPYDPPAPEAPKEKYRQPEPPRPPSNEKIRDDIRNSGGRNDKEKGKRR